MKIPNISDGQAQIVIGIAAIGVALYAIYQVSSGVRKVTDGVGNGVKAVKDSVVDFVTDEKNPINGAAKTVVGEQRLQKGFDKIFDFFNPDIKKQRQAVESTLKPSVKLSPMLTAESYQPVDGFRFYQAGNKK